MAVHLRGDLNWTIWSSSANRNWTSSIAFRPSAQLESKQKYLLKMFLRNADLALTCFEKGALAFLPLFCIKIVILPLFFLLCEFIIVISKQSTSLPLLRHPPLTVLNFV